MTDDAKPFVLPVLVDRYLADTTHLSTEAHGAYFLLLMAAWKRGGQLPDNDKQLREITRLTPARWRAHRDTLREFFRHDGAGHLVQKRLSLELARVHQQSASKSAAGAKGARSRWQNDGSANGTAMRLPDGTAIPESMAQPSVCHPLSPHSPLSPTPTPTPTPALDSSPLRSEESLAARVRPTPGEACRAMRQAGMAEVQPSDPRLRTLIDQGATAEEFGNAAREAVALKKGFGYALAIVIGRRADAERLSLAPAAPKSEIAAKAQQLTGGMSIEQIYGEDAAHVDDAHP